MSRRKGELTPAARDREWPHQIVKPSSDCMGPAGDQQRAFLMGRSFCPRSHSIFHNDRHYHVFCFSIREDAEAFKTEFGGDWFDPRERGKGANWNKWYK